MQDNFVLYSNDLKWLYQFEPLNEKHSKANFKKKYIKFPNMFGSFISFKGVLPQIQFSRVLCVFLTYLCSTVWTLSFSPFLYYVHFTF